MIKHLYLFIDRLKVFDFFWQIQNLA